MEASRLEYYRKLSAYYQELYENQNEQLLAEDGYEECQGCGLAIYADYSVNCKCEGIFCSKCVKAEFRFRSTVRDHAVRWECAACGVSGSIADVDLPARPIEPNEFP